METVVILSFLFIIYTYFLYPLILMCYTGFINNNKTLKDYFPEVTVIISAFNEEKSIRNTVESILNSSYPPEHLDILVLSDGSTDRTDEIIRSMDSPRVRLIHLYTRLGKNKAIEANYRTTKSEILVFADASSVFLLNTISLLCRHFSNPKTGCVVGAKTIVQSNGEVSQGDGLYWKYESLLRRLESNSGSSLIGVEGGIFAIRKNVLNMNFPGEHAADISIGCNVFQKGYSIRYEPKAIIYEVASENIEMEFSRKVRVIVRGIKSLASFSYLLNPFKYPSFFFQNVSHKIFRWIVPFFLIVMIISSGFSDHSVFRIFFILQVFFYSTALLSFILKKLNIKIQLFNIALYFTTVNLSALIAWFQLHKKFDVWSPTVRDHPVINLKK